MEEQERATERMNKGCSFLLNILHYGEREQEIELFTKKGKIREKKTEERKRKGSRSNCVQLQQELRRKVKWLGEGGGTPSNLM